MIRRCLNLAPALLTLLFAVPASAAPQVPCTGTELATISPYAATHTGADGGALYFDMTVNIAGGLRMQGIELNLGSPAGTPFNLMVYARVGTWHSNQNSNSGWIIATTGQGVSAGPGQPTSVDLADVVVPNASWGISLVLFGASHAYTAGNGANQAFSMPGLSLSLGGAGDAPFSGTLPNPYVWNGKLLFECPPPPPQPYCTSGITTNFCMPSMWANRQPSASMAAPCFINVDNVEGMKQGLLFYGLDNSGFVPKVWGTGTSYLCVKSPTQRTGVQNSGGSPDQCDGFLSLDWNTWQSAHPSALGQPFAVGDSVFVQGWFRDPAASKSTNLSNALQLTLQP
jgi:hypothetical protein